MSETGPEIDEKDRLKDHISGLSQKIIGEIEEIGGVLTGDPTTQAEGEFNIEVGDIRDKLEGEIDEDAVEPETPTRPS
ncbi:MAG TPA: hypothetical protein VGI80_08020 [Pyrinomonadaceae bacterium]|jgi:uncharacterized protein YjbJ (UPF0337 family)